MDHIWARGDSICRYSHICLQISDAEVKEKENEQLFHHGGDLAALDFRLQLVLVYLLLAEHQKCVPLH